MPGWLLPEPMWYGRVWSVCGLCRYCWQGGWRACLNVGAPGADPPTFVAVRKSMAKVLGPCCEHSGWAGM